MIPRYSRPEMARLFTDEARLGWWLEVEILATEAWGRLGVVPDADAQAVRQRAPFAPASRPGEPLVAPEVAEAVARREAATGHDVAAFVDVIQEAVGPPAGKWVHYGLTSSDVVDTALGATLARAGDLLIDASRRLAAALETRAQEFRLTAMAGRTHGIHAEPTTFGAKLALWSLQAHRDRRRLQAARAEVAVGKLSGAVGTYSNIDPAVEASVCAALGLTPVPANQVVARDRHAQYVMACAAAAASVELFATEIRHLQRTEVAEVEEPFRPGQKGSSAMPHKRNPVTCEQLCGLARVVRGHVAPALENVALWHERDISHSSVERVILPDASLLTYYLLVRMTEVIEGMTVHPDRMRENIDRSFGLMFSQPVLLALVATGLTRDEAYRIVQRNAQSAWAEGKPFRSYLEADPEVTLSPDELDKAFSLDKALANTGTVFDALKEVTRE